MKALLIEDSEQLSKSISNFLTIKGFGLDMSLDGHEGYKMALEGDYDIIILDLMLPGRDGKEILKSIRAAGKTTPLIVITAKATLQDKLSCFRIGADDYIVKPFEMKELYARIIALLRRIKPVVRTRIKYKDLELDIDNHILRNTTNDMEVTLSSKEFLIIEALFKNKEQILEKSILYSKAWGGAMDKDNNTVDVYIHFLRKKIKSLNSGIMIRVQKNVGYGLFG